MSRYRVMSIFLVSTLTGSLYSAISDPQAYIAGERKISRIAEAFRGD